MTTYNKANLKTYFETGDVPAGSDYANLIDSQINIAETGLQAMTGALSATEIITPLVSATQINATGMTVTGAVSAGSFSITTISVVSADATKLTIGDRLIQPAAIVSAAGTAQGTATICSATLCRVQGVADGATTGVALMANRIGFVQYVVNETGVSANLWPPTGGTINALSANAAFALAANTQYTVLHTAASAYRVK